MIWPALVALLVAGLWHLAARWSTTRAAAWLDAVPTDDRAALLVFAHPDDESMFFAPLIATLRKHKWKVHLLSLSSGNYDGLGSTRLGELQAVAKEFGCASCTVVHDRRCLDGPKNVWPASVVQEKVQEVLTGKADGAVSAMFTFDRFGVSGHPNHIDVANGVAAMASHTDQQAVAFRAARAAAGCSAPAVYRLVTRSLLEKYTGPFVALLRGLAAGPKAPVEDDTRLSADVSTAIPRPDPAYPRAMLLLPPMQFWVVAWRGMRLHRSQLVWFRYLYLAFSQYAYANLWVRIDAADAPTASATAADPNSVE